MLTKHFKLFATITALVIYNGLFWQEKFGINLLLFSTLLAFIIIKLKRDSIQSSHVKILLAGTLLTGLFVSYHNSTISKFTHILSFILLAGSVHSPHLRNLYHILFGAVSYYITAPISLLTQT